MNFLVIWPTLDFNVATLVLVTQMTMCILSTSRKMPDRGKKQIT